MKPLFPSPGLLALAALCLTWFGCNKSEKEVLRSPSDERYLSMVGKPAPPLKFTALDGREVDLEKLRGKVVLLDFWATWCPPCMAEVPHVRAAYERFNKEGFEIVGVSFDAERARLEDVVKRENLAWPQYFDGAGRDAAPGKTFGIRHWPSMWLLDRNGVVRYISAGAELEEKIATLLKQNANPVTTAANVFEKKAALDKSGDEPAKPTAPTAATTGGPISPPGAPQDPAYLSWLGKPFPRLQFTAIDQRAVDSEALRGRVLLIDFWATWCGPCMAEIPHVKAAYDRFHKDGFEIIGISADVERADLERVVRERNLPWPQLFEARDGPTPTLRRYGIQHFPTMWLVDRQGIIRDVTGAVALEDKVAKLIREPSGSANTSSATASTAPSPASRVAEVKLGDQAIAVKNITIGSKRNTALLQIGSTTYTVAPGMDLRFIVGGRPKKAQCVEIQRDTVLLTVEGRPEPLRLALP